MKCPNCGNDCADGARFCTECGCRFQDSANAPEATAEQPKKQPEEQERSAVPARPASEAPRRADRPRNTKKNKKLLFAVAAAAVLIVIIAAAVAVGAMRKVSGYTVEVKTRYATPEPHLLVDDRGMCYDLSEYDVSTYSLFTSLDGKTAAVLGKKHASDVSGVLLLICDAKLSKVADGVYDCAVSDNGASVAYAVSGDETGLLYLYNVKKQASSLVSGGIYSPLSSSGLPDIFDLGVLRGMFVLSPDGRSIAFTKKVNDGTRAYVSVKGSEPVPIAADSYPVALANNGKYIYYIRRSISLTEYNYKFSVASGDEVRHLSLDALHLGDALIFNRDRTEVIFADDGITYMSRKGAERQRIASGEISGIVVPGDGAARSESFPFIGVCSMIYARKTIGGSAFISNGGLYYLDRALEISVISSNFGGASIAPDGRSLYYIDTSSGRDGSYGSIYYLDDIEKNGSKELVTADIEATDISAPDNMKGVYVRDLDRTLWYVTRNGKKQKRICDELVDWCVDVRDGGVWFTSALEDSDTVWYSSRGSKKKSVVKADLASVKSQNFMRRSVFFTATSYADSGKHTELCRVRSGKKYTVVTGYDVQN